MSELIRKSARSAFFKGDYDTSERLYDEYLSENKENLGALLHYGICLEIKGQKADAYEYYRQYDSLEGGSHALRENIRGRALFRQQYPSTDDVHIECDPNKAITMSRLIGWGRFGNQLLEYFYLSIHSRIHGLQLFVPYWLGRDLFALADGILVDAKKFDDKKESSLAMVDGLSPDKKSFAGIDIKGFCQLNTKHYAPYKEIFSSLYRPIRSLEIDLNSYLTKVKSSYQSLIAVHIRRTDYIGSNFDINDLLWIKEWLSKQTDITKSVVYIASDDPEMANEFKEFNSISMNDFDDCISGAEFLLDWWVLAHANKVAIDNSTFSLTASMKNQIATEFVRPNLESSSMEIFDPWSTYVLDSI